MARPPDVRSRESEVLAACLRLLDVLNIPHWRANAGAGWRLGKHGKPQLVRAGPEGLSDICGWLPGRGTFMALEVKRPGERPRPAQVAFLRRLNADGGMGLWVSDVGELHAALTRVIRDGARVAMAEDGTWELVEP